MLKFTKEHEWLRVDGDVATVGITQFAQEQLGDVVFVELPKLGKPFDAGAAVAVVESVKAASEIYMPCAGEITEINQKIVDEPALVNSDPMGEGWFFRMKIVNRSEIEPLMDEAAYRQLVG